jgi:carbonic anhydrase/acetyltransferase-like protein (isoleucine patch superfamily)
MAVMPIGAGVIVCFRSFLILYLNLPEENMVGRAALIKEIDTLPPRYYGEVVDFVGYIKEKKLRETLSLEKAAEAAADEYRSNKELTAFCALDGEDFYETR